MKPDDYVESTDTASGTCGDNLTWVLDSDGTLTISGTGEMSDDIPWSELTSSIQNVVIEEGVTSIGDGAFSFCSSLASITIPEGVTDIGEYAFGWCRSLMSVVISNNVTSIGNYAFIGCTSLVTITIPKSVTSIGEEAFADCDKLTGIWVDENNANYSNDARGVLFNKNKTVLVAAPTAIEGEYNIPSGVTCIRDHAFADCDSLTSITIANSVTDIGEYTFEWCSSLTSVAISDNVTSIGKGTFDGCYSLTTITIPASVTTIECYAFDFCSSLATVIYLGTQEQKNVISISYGNDSLINAQWRYQTASATVPTLNLVAPSLNFEDEIYYNVYYTASDVTDIVEMGLITFDSYLAEATIDDAAEFITGYVKVGGNYMSHTNGIPAKMLGDTLYFRVYAKLTDGTYAYSPTAGYHAVAYAKDILANSTNEKMKALVVAMLNYGAAAQIHFDYKTDALVNSFLTAEQQVLVSEYNSNMVDSIVAADGSKTGNFAGFSGGYTALNPSVAFEGAFAINYYFTPAKAMDDDMKLYYWTMDDYNAADVLTTENATGVVTMEASATTGQFVGAVTGIAAKQIDRTVYVCGVYESEGVGYCTGVIAYSLASYCLDRIANGSATMQEFAKETVVYGSYAKAYFA